MPYTAYFDLETGSAGELFTYGPGYVRLCGVALNDEPQTWITTDPARLRSVLERADTISAYNGFAFDLIALARWCGADYDALARKTVDPMRVAQVLDPPGSKHQKPWSEKGYYSMNTLASRLGVPGKTDDLAALAAKHGGYDRIPPDDPDYRRYLRGDLHALRAVHQALGCGDLPEYTRREMRVAHLQNRMTFNGWRIDVPELERRIEADELARQGSLRWLAEHCGVPLTETRTRGRGAAKVAYEEPRKSPLASGPGRDALREAFRRAGAPYVPETATGIMALSSDALGEGSYMVGKGAAGSLRPGMLSPRAYGDNDAVREICGHVTRVTGTTGKYAEIAKHLVGDRVHARIGSEDEGSATDQASGRWAMVKPSTTNLGKRGGKVVQRGVFVSDPGNVLKAFDMDQVDMRAIAGLSQDPAYMSLFGPGMDAHSLIADQIFGRHDGEFRERAKKSGHGWNYGLSENGMVNTGIPREIAHRFSEGMEESYQQLIKWRAEVRERAGAGEMLDNGFGRLMRCDPAKAWTQGPALMGQGGARDLLCTGLLEVVDRIPEAAAWLRGVVHDEIVFDIPEQDAEEASHEIVKAMTFEWRGVPITCGASRAATDWASCYSK